MATKQSSEVTVTTDDPPAPSGVSATVQSNEQIDVSWSDNGLDSGQYHVQLVRDGVTYNNPSGGPTTVGNNTTSATYTPNSDTSYYKQVGIDSSFVFRVRAEADGSSSGWDYSSLVYTDPVPPRILDVSRPNENAVKIKIEKRSDAHSDFEYLDVQYRKDTGSGYGNWIGLEYLIRGAEASVVSGSWNGASKGSTITLKYTTSGSYRKDESLSTNARHQFRIRDNQKTPNQSQYKNGSEWIYHDYGNENNVWLEDNCDAETWDYSAGSPEVYTGSNADAGISGSVTGSGTILCRGGEDVEWNVDNADNSDAPVLVKARVASGSMDTSGKDGVIQWYDGSNWQDLSKRYGWEYNKQGWVEVTKLVPSDWVNGNNNIRFRNPHGGDGDYFFIDEVIVSDLLHEYTNPAPPTNVGFDSSNQRDIIVDWTNQSPFVATSGKQEIGYKTTDASSYNGFGPDLGNAPYTITGLTDGERYEVIARSTIEQPRNGEQASSFYIVDAPVARTTTLLPEPNLSVSATGGTANLSWTKQDNNSAGDYEILRSTDGGSSYTTVVSSLSSTTTAYNDGGVSSGGTYDYKLRRSTPDASSSTKFAIGLGDPGLVSSTISSTALSEGNSIEGGQLTSQTPAPSTVETTSADTVADASAVSALDVVENAGGAVVTTQTTSPFVAGVSDNSRVAESVVTTGQNSFTALATALSNESLETTGESSHDVVSSTRAGESPTTFGTSSTAFDGRSSANELATTAEISYVAGVSGLGSSDEIAYLNAHTSPSLSRLVASGTSDLSTVDRQSAPTIGEKALANEIGELLQTTSLDQLDEDGNAGASISLTKEKTPLVLELVAGVQTEFVEMSVGGLPSMSVGSDGFGSERAISNHSSEQRFNDNSEILTTLDVDVGSAVAGTDTTRAISNPLVSITRSLGLDERTSSSEYLQSEVTGISESDESIPIQEETAILSTGYTTFGTETGISLESSEMAVARSMAEIDAETLGRLKAVTERGSSFGLVDRSDVTTTLDTSANSVLNLLDSSSGSTTLGILAEGSSSGSGIGLSSESGISVVNSTAETNAKTLGELKAISEQNTSLELIDASNATSILDARANSVLDLLDSSSGSTTLDILAESTKDFDETTASREKIQSTLNTLLSLSGFASSAERTLEGVSPVPALEIDGVSAGVESGLVTSQSPVLVSEEIPLTEALKIYTGADNSITHGIIRVVRSVDRQRGVQSETNSDVNYEDSGSVNYTNKNQTRGDN